jgi:ATP-dependent DNA helicase RecG
MSETLKKKPAGGAARKPGSRITDHGSRSSVSRSRITDHGSRSSDHGLRARARLGLSTDWDFILHLPLRYIDETRVTPIADAQVGSEVQVEGEVVRSEVVFRGRRQLIATLRDDSGELLLRFLNFYPSQQKQLAPGRRVRALGTVRGGMLGLEIVHPLMRAADLDRPLPQRLTPVYPTTEGVAQTWLRKRIERALRDVDITESVPAPLAERCRLLPLAMVLRELHQPLPDADIAALIERRDPRWRRVGFDELLAQQLAMRIARKQRAAQTALPIARGALAQRLLHALPFQLTGAQQRVGQQIEADLARGTPMHRLLQGDVGSGKTVIAALAAASAIDAGMQAALMAPTEILAEQHFRRIAAWLEPLGVRIVWLTGKLRAAEKRAAHAAIAEGSAQLVIGTHALIQDAVRFARLGLAIVDEQHRFGVAQRLALRAAEGIERRVPHLLMLSATPIPRTLAMSYLADLDVSTIDELPPGRTPVLTKLVSTARRAEVLARVRDEVQQGRQAYWVCPLVEESDKLDAALELTAATTMFEQTRAELPELRWGLAHGQLPAAEKAAVMTRFAEGAIDVLVATTVIEVGVDVPRASLMVIEHAQRFGLAQLHQLRGRVGRGTQQSVCVLLYDEPLSDTARERLKVIYESTDGFEIARRDLQLRGPGEFLGARQSGLPLLRFADLERDAALVEQARACAELMLRDHPEAARAHVARWLGSRAAMLDA